VTPVRLKRTTFRTGI